MSDNRSGAATRRMIRWAYSVPVLGRDEERRVILRWQRKKDREALRTLVECSFRHVVSIALGYRRYGAPLDDMISDGSVGLLIASTRFDVSFGTRFSTYASYWIRAEVMGGILRQWSIVNSGKPLRSKLFFKLRRERARLQAQVGEGGDYMDKLSTTVGIDRPRLESYLCRLDRHDLSLDAASGLDREDTLLDHLAASGASPEIDAGTGETDRLLGSRVEQAIKSLDERERLIVRSRLCAEEERSFADIGRELGISRERVRQLEVRARSKLRAHLGDLAPLVCTAA